MNADHILGYGCVLIGFGVLVLILVWVLLCLTEPWADRTVAKHIEAADAAEYPELEQREER